MGRSSDVGLVCFDLGRVLVRICDDWRQACELAGVVPGATAFQPSDRPRFLDAVCRVEVGGMSHAEFCEAVAPLFGVGAHEVSAVSDAFPRGPYDGAAELLDGLSQLRVSTACLSNTNENHWRLMGDPSSHTYFPFHKLTHAFASHLVRLRKPDDAIYAHVERATGIPGGRIVFFDDVKENVEAARRRGWRACHIDPRPDDPVSQVRAFLAAQGIRL